MGVRSCFFSKKTYDFLLISGRRSVLIDSLHELKEVPAMRSLSPPRLRCFLEPAARLFFCFCKSMILSLSQCSAAQLGSAASQWKLKLNTNLCEDYWLTCGPLAFQEEPDQTRWESLLTPPVFFFTRTPTSARTYEYNYHGCFMCCVRLLVV